MSRTKHPRGRSNHFTRDIGPHYTYPKTSENKRILRRLERRKRQRADRMQIEKDNERGRAATT